MHVKCPDGEVRKGIRDGARILVTINNKKVFAGYGVGNMVRHFRIVPAPTPKKGKK